MRNQSISDIRQRPRGLDSNGKILVFHNFQCRFDRILDETNVCNANIEIDVNNEWNDVQSNGLPSHNDGNKAKMAKARTADAQTSGSSSLNDNPDNSEMIRICLSRCNDSNVLIIALSME